MPSVVILGSSARERLELRAGLRPEPGLELRGEGGAGSAAVRLVSRTRPDLVLLLLTEPEDQDTLRTLMQEAPRPVVVLVTPEAGAGAACRALSLGALEALPRLPPRDSPEHASSVERLVRLVRVLSSVPVVTRSRAPAAPQPVAGQPQGRRSAAAVRARPGLVVLGASTGGPPVLADILKSIPAEFPVPIAVVQHMSPGLRKEFAQWLAQAGRHPTVTVEAPTELRPGHVFLAPDDRHMAVLSRSVLGPLDDVPRCYQRPSVDVLFESAAKQLGAEVIGVLLTGMGRDGAAGLAALKESGALTLAQSLATCAVDSMPRGAIERRAVDIEASPAEIANLLSARGS